MVELWENVETFASVEVPQFALSTLVVNDYGSSYGAHRCSIKVERPVVVLPGINSWGYGGFLQEIKDDFSLRK